MEHLIKNKIFEILDDTEPADFAEEKWQQIKKILNDGKEIVGIETFYRHFWSSRYKKSAKNKLYDDFNKIIVPKNKKVYTEFLLEMEKYANYYIMIMNPKREYYNNRKEYYPVVQMLNVLNNYFGIVQVRIVELAIVNLKEKGLIDLKYMKHILALLESFHFVYNSIMRGNPNSVEKVYSAFAIETVKCTDKTMVKELVKNKLVVPLQKLLPKQEEFIDNFVELKYSKRDLPTNIKTKYVLNRINCYYEDKELFSEDGTIEHIISEVEGEECLNIGNLILLENELNEEADSMKYCDKIAIYERSQYKWVKDFISKNPNWISAMILDRAKGMAKFYYDNILKKDMDIS